MHRIILPLAALALTSPHPLAQSTLVLQQTPGTRIATSADPLVVHVRPAEDEDDAQGRAGTPAEVGVWVGMSLKGHTDGEQWLEVVEVIPGSPAERAGIQAGDKLLSIAGRTASNHAALLDLLRSRRPGETVAIAVERSRKAKLQASTEDESQPMLGIQSGNSGADGLRVQQVVPQGAAAAAGIAAGDRISAVDGHEVGSIEELRTQIRAHQIGDEVEVRTQRSLNVELEARPARADDGRTITGMGGHAFGTAPEPRLKSKTKPEKQGKTPKPNKLEQQYKAEKQERSDEQQPEQRNGGSLFTPEPGHSDPWIVPPPPATPRADQPEHRSYPRSPGNDMGAERRRPMPPTPGDGLSAELLGEIRALRAEVAALRREIEELREKQSPSGSGR